MGKATYISDDDDAVLVLTMNAESGKPEWPPFLRITIDCFEWGLRVHRFVIEKTESVPDR